MPSSSSRAAATAKPVLRYICFPLELDGGLAGFVTNGTQSMGKGYFQSSSASSSSSTYSSSSSSSNSSADSISSGSVPTTFKSAPHSSQLRESPSSTSSSSTSIWPSHTGQDTITSSPKYRYTKLHGHCQLYF